MLQNTEYQVGPYLKWWWRTGDFNKVAKRRKLDNTSSAKILVLALWFGIIAQILTGIWLLWLEYTKGISGGRELGLALIISYPLIWGQLIVIPVWFGRVAVTNPNERRLIKQSQQVFKDHNAVKIAVAGSYGKTSVKEILATVLAEGKKVAATPANKNVSISHALFARTLTGDEEVLIIEYGEGKPGDVKRFVSTTRPNIGIITGIAPAHLDHYKTVAAAGKDIFYLAYYLKHKKVYVNGGSNMAEKFINVADIIYSEKGVANWKVSNVEISLTNGTNFTLTNGKKKIKVESKLLGRHQIGPLALAADIADELGMSIPQIENGLNKTAAYEHRMQPYKLHGAWVIDDTYNGNIEGIQAGLELLSELPAKKRIYITPGLVDQGEETEQVHLKMGELIAKSQPDTVVLMKNSVTKFIQQGMDKHGFKGEVKIETNPLDYYKSLEHILAAGDVVLMQNDWTDNYA